MDEAKLRSALGIVAALLFAYAGLQMLWLKSQAPAPTVAELFDNYVGIACLGFAALSLMFGLPRMPRLPEPPPAEHD